MCSGALARPAGPHTNTFAQFLRQCASRPASHKSAFHSSQIELHIFCVYRAKSNIAAKLASSIRINRLQRHRVRVAAVQNERPATQNFPAALEKPAANPRRAMMQRGGRMPTVRGVTRGAWCFCGGNSAGNAPCNSPRGPSQKLGKLCGPVGLCSGIQKERTVELLRRVLRKCGDMAHLEIRRISLLFALSRTIRFSCLENPSRHAPPQTLTTFPSA